MSLNNFYVYILVLTMGLMQAHTFFVHHFSGVDTLKERIVRLERQIQQEKVKTQIAYHEAETMRQDVATLLPDKIKSNASYQVRNLASVLQVQEPLGIDSSKKYLKKGKDFFSQHRYNEAISTFKTMIDKYPESTGLAECYFLLSESFYQVQAIEDTVDTIDTMVSLFPESELTGFALLRLSGIFIERQLTDDAKEILYTVLNSFSYNQELSAQAHLLLRRVE